ncbi:16S rRNA (guanine(966)-N(2))-methyltransferase RsmD [Bdellovibrio sp. HCB337]|uniref:16S rRNA (guanine(966)-N(2))-methyltransferase RsmD n=1 Tax=Bdellovibrio sp. HCB337 TaxID=3394358 RepID=UPI0039A4D493
MRIISGKYKGHPLVEFKADHIRPTTDRVKETLFNKLMFELEGTKVLDLFAGTGNLGIEALSRGAREVTFVEKHPKSLEILKKNLAKLKIPAVDYKIINADVLTYLKKYNDEPFDIIFADPPFTEKMAHAVMEHASLSQAFGAHTLLTIESERRERMEDLYGDLERYDHREFGDKILSFFSKKRDKESHE